MASLRPVDVTVDAANDSATVQSSSKLFRPAPGRPTPIIVVAPIKEYTPTLLNLDGLPGARANDARESGPSGKSLPLKRPVPPGEGWRAG